MLEILMKIEQELQQCLTFVNRQSKTAFCAWQNRHYYSIISSLSLLELQNKKMLYECCTIHIVTVRQKRHFFRAEHS